MALRSNILLRQKLTKVKFNRPSSFHQKTNLLQNEVIFEVEESSLKREDNEMVELIQASEAEDVDNEVEYLTVILENDGSTESGDETVEIETLVESTTEHEAIQNEDYAISDEMPLDEIPKMSLKRSRNRRRAKDIDHNHSLTCPECGKTLSNFSSYKYHMQLHSEDTPFLCSECGEAFKTRNAYDGHLITHLESNPNQCNVCGKTYRQAASLRSHMLTHTGEKVRPKSVFFHFKSLRIYC